MAYANLEEKLQALGGAMEMACNSQIGPYVYRRCPPSSRTGARSRSRGGDERPRPVASHADLQIEARTRSALSDLGVNSFATFAVNKAKQLVVCNRDGHVIGDGILFYLEENRVRLSGALGAQLGAVPRRDRDYDVEVSRDERTAVNPTGRRQIYRFQVQAGPDARRPRKANGGSLPRSSSSTWASSRRRPQVRALHHGMSGVPGLELGP